MITKKNILGVHFTNATEEKVLEYLLDELKTSKKQFYVVTPNPELLVYASHDPHYRHILNEAKLCLPDGIGVFLASVFLGKSLPERIPGADFVEYFCKNVGKNPVSIGFLGGRDGVAEQASQRLKEKYPWITVAFVAEEWTGAPSPATPRISQMVGKTPSPSEIDLLFVAFGSPKQEQWIYDNLHRLPVKAAMGVGGAFDFISGKVSRAPYLIRAMGMEWLFRLIRQPWRWKRQLALGEFVWLVLRQRFGKRI